MTSEEMIQQMDEMDNGERIEFLKYLGKKHFFINTLTREEMHIIDELRDGYLKVVENDD